MQIPITKEKYRNEYMIFWKENFKIFFKLNLLSAFIPAIISRATKEKIIIFINISMGYIFEWFGGPMSFEIG